MTSDEAQRIAVMTILASVAVSSFVAVLCFWERIFYLEAGGTPADAWRLLWMVPFSAAGLSWRAWKWRRYGTNLQPGDREPGPLEPWLSYLLTYPVLLAMGNVLAFAAMHSFLSLGNWLFYLVAPVFALTLARAPGRWQDLLRFSGLTEPRQEP